MSKQDDFLKMIAPVIQKVAKARGYRFASPVIAQAILESGWGDSKLAKSYNYFGMKAGSSWKGKTQTMNTQEQLSDGRYVTVKAVFRAYGSLEEGINGYFDFISASRYANLKAAASPLDYLQKIKADGYATDHNYVSKVYNVVQKYYLEKYDLLDEMKEPQEEQIPGDLKAAAEVFARYCIAGLLGNGEDRKNRIYKIVQDCVNGALKS